MQEGSAVQRKCTRALGKVSPKLLGHVLALVGGPGALLRRVAHLLLPRLELLLLLLRLLLSLP